MKTVIARGTSPIAGKGRFPAYKNPSNYPGGRKPNSPVNLKLSGKFLNSLTNFAPKSGVGGNFFPQIGFRKNSLSDKKEQGHREGANGQRIRPIIPEGQESLSAQVLGIARKIMLVKIEKQISRRNKDS